MLNKLKRFLNFYTILLSATISICIHESRADISDAGSVNGSPSNQRSKPKNLISQTDESSQMKDSAIRYNYGLIKFSRGFYESAADDFSTIIEETIDSPIQKESYIMNILSLFLAKRYEDAESESERFLKRYPMDKYASYIKNIALLANTKGLMGDYISVNKLGRTKILGNQLLNGSDIKKHRDSARFYTDLATKAQESNLIKTAQFHYNRGMYTASLAMYNQIISSEILEHKKIGILMSYECFNKIGLLKLSDEYLKQYVELELS